MKMTKKLGSLLLAVLLLLSLSVTAFAAPTEVTPKDEEGFHLSISKSAGEHSYTAYQIFTGDLAKDAEGKEVLSNIEWGNGLTTKGKSTLISRYCPDNPGATAADVAKAIAGTPADVMAAEIAALVETENAIALTENGEVYTSGPLAAGYYLVLDELTKDAEGAAVSDYVVQVLGDTPMTPKASAPSVEKKVQDKNDSTGETSGWQDFADYDIGDSVPFQLTATLPSTYADYVSYKLVFHDTATNLSIPETVKVSFGDTSISVGTTTPGADGCSFEVVIDDVKTTFSGAKAGDEIVVTYEAELLGTANLGAEGNPNKVVLEYSNNPNGEGTGHTPEDKVTVFTYGLVVEKQDGDEKPLAGAGFTLSKKNADGTYAAVGAEKFVYGVDADGKPTDVEEDIVRYVVDFSGLDAGDYKLEETKTPAGFNTIDPIEFTITAEHDLLSDDPGLTKLGATDLDVDEASGVASGVLTTTIVNQSGLTLPETGGMGTTIFYVAGGILVAVALILLVTKRRVKAEQ